MHKPRVLKGDVTWLIGAFVGLIAVFLALYYFDVKATDTLFGSCVTGLKTNLIYVNGVIADKLRNDGDKTSVPLKVPDCAESWVFANREDFSRLGLVAPESEGVLECPEGYKSMMAVFPVIEKISAGGWFQLFAMVKDEQYKAALKKIAASKLEPFCKALHGKDYTFEKSVRIPGNKKEEFYCLTIERGKGGKFSITGDKEVISEKKYQKCIEESER